ncbi:MAG: MerR family transcriptional regulator [Pseudorhodoplanes sp.]
MDDALDIRQVARRTGLTSRALRFYEARGLLKPLRAYSGRRFYGPSELERISQIVALKRAGLTLTQIEKLTRQRRFDLGALVDAQLDALAHREAELAEAKALLVSVKSRIDRGEPVDAETFCSLIRNGDTNMEAEKWKAALERHYAPEELAHWAENPPPADFDQEAYSRKWSELGARIEAALPLDPAGTEAQAFVKEWNDLLAPFRAVATPQMMEGAQRFWEKAEQHWAGMQMPFSPAVMRFIQEAGAARSGEDEGAGGG